MRRWAAVAVLVVVAVLGCSRPRTVIMVEDKDPEMDAAIAQARAEVPVFVKALQAPEANDRFFSVKAAIREGEDVEHFWIDDVAYDGTAFIAGAAEQGDEAEDA